VKGVVFLKLVSAAQMRAMDRRAIEEFGVPSIVLMENAALRAVDCVVEQFAPIAGKRIVIACGLGNNGGDGLAMARHLHTRFGARVSLWLAGASDQVKGDAAANLKMAKSFGLVPKSAADDWQSAFRDELDRADLVVDALLGTGSHGAPAGVYAEMIEIINGVGKPVVAVDIPSGVDSDTGAAAGAAVRAAVTVTFALPKLGLLLYPGLERAGRLVVADLGLPAALLASAPIAGLTVEPADIAGWLPPRSESRDNNKGTFGHVVVFAGSRGMIGAAVLSAEAAARSGAGLVTLAVPKGAQDAVMARVSPVVMTRGLADDAEGGFSEGALEDALALASRATAVALGPGVGGSENTRGFVRRLIERCNKPMIVDADALNALAADRDAAAQILRRRTAETVLSPHPGEMGRLLGLETEVVQEDRLAAVKRSASEFEVVVILKGARTLIASPDGVLYVNTTGNSGMATGGAGDVLTGVTGALLGGRMPAIRAAAAAAYIHGLAGDLVAEDHRGKAGLIAVDLVDALPRAIGRVFAG